MRSAFAAASWSGSPRSIAPPRSASAIAPSELTPRISPSNPAFLSASPNEPPISPTPTITTVRNSNAPAHGGRNPAKLAHQFVQLLGEERLRAVTQRSVGIVMRLDEQPAGSGSHGRARHRRPLIAPPPAVRRIGHDRQMRQFLHHRNRR